MSSDCCGAKVSFKENNHRREEDDPKWIYYCHECRKECCQVDEEEWLNHLEEEDNE